MTELKFVDVEEESFHCLDGRARNPSLFSPGGDFGEFVTALLAYENMKAIELTQTQVDNIFKAYLESMSHKEFWWCTDEQAKN